MEILKDHMDLNQQECGQNVLSQPFSHFEIRRLSNEVRGLRVEMAEEHYQRAKTFIIIEVS